MSLYPNPGSQVRTQLQKRLQQPQNPGPMPPPESPEVSTAPQLPSPIKQAPIAPSPTPTGPAAPSPAPQFNLGAMTGGNTGYTGGVAARSESGGPMAAGDASEAASNPRGWFLGLASKYAPGGKIGQEGLQQLASDPEFQSAGWRLGNPNASGIIDSVIGPQGQVVDVSRNSMAGGGTGELYWGAYGPSAGNWAEGGGGGAAGGGAGGGAGAAGGGGFTSNIRELLLQQLMGLSQPVNENDPSVAGQLQSQDRLIERERQNRRAAMAERAAQAGQLSGGASSGAFDAELASGYEDATQQKSDVRARLMSQELSQRRDKLTQLLSLAVQSGDNEAARAIQLQIAQMNNALGQAQLAQQGSQWNEQFGLNAAQWLAAQENGLLGGF